MSTTYGEFDAGTFSRSVGQVVAQFGDDGDHGVEGLVDVPQVVLGGDHRDSVPHPGGLPRDLSLPVAHAVA